MTDVLMPQMGESIVEGTLTKWLKKPGEKVERDEPLFEISTDKVDTEIPSPAAGTLADVMVQEGQTVGVNAIVARIDDGGGTPAAAPAQPAAAAPPPPSAPPPAPRVPAPQTQAAPPAASPGYALEPQPEPAGAGPYPYSPGPAPETIIPPGVPEEAKEPQGPLSPLV